MAEVKMRFNLDAEEVELVVDGQVALSSGKEVFTNWVGAYNDKHKPAVVEPVKVEAPVVETPVPVAEPVVVPVNQNEIETPTVQTEEPLPLDTAKEV